MKNNIYKSGTILQVSGYLLILAVWFLIAAYNRGIASKPFPWPWDAAASIFKPDNNGYTALAHAGFSMIRWIAGYLLAAVSGVVTGIFTGLFLNVNYLLTPLLTSLQLIPGLAWVPIVLILFGLGNFSTIFMIAMTAFVPVAINTRAGITQLEPVLFRASEMMELSFGRKFLHVILPGAAPSILSGLRVGAANGFRVLISAEMIVGTGAGLGYSIFQARWNLDYNSAFGSLILIILLGLLIDKVLFIPLEKRLYNRRGLSGA